jgi:hypothetical protein
LLLNIAVLSKKTKDDDNDIESKLLRQVNEEEKARHLHQPLLTCMVLNLLVEYARTFSLPLSAGNILYINS